MGMLPKILLEVGSDPNVETLELQLNIFNDRSKVPIRKGICTVDGQVNNE